MNKLANLQILENYDHMIGLQKTDSCFDFSPVVTRKFERPNLHKAEFKMRIPTMIMQKIILEV